MSNRKATEDFIIRYIDKLLPGSDNVGIYKELFGKMSDEDFDTFMKKLEIGKNRLAVIALNFGQKNLMSKET